jgi:phage major head subunit gpT-like protein
MAGQFNPENLDIVRRTTRADFYAELGVAQQDAMWPELSMEVDSDSDQEVLAFFGSIPKPNRVSGGQPGDQKAHERTPLKDWSMTVINARWKTNTPIHRDVLEDAKLDQLRVRARQQAENAQAFLDERFTEVLEANNNTYDGAAYFGGTHHGVTSAAKDNDLADAAPTDPAAPTTTEFENAFADCLTGLRGLTDDQARIANTGPLSLVTMVPPKYERAARSVIEVGPVAGQTGNSGVFKGMGKVVVNPFLTAANNIFFVFATSRSVKPVVYSNREEWEFKLLTSGDAWDLEDMAHMISTGRFEFRLGDWKKAVRMTLT